MVFDALEDRTLMTLAPVIFHSGNLGTSTVAPYVTATTPTIVNGMVCSTITNAAGSGHNVVIGTAVYKCTYGTPGTFQASDLPNEILMGIDYSQTLKPGQTATICVNDLPCIQYDTFVRSIDGTTVQNVVTQFPSPGSFTLFQTPGYSTFGPPIGNTTHPVSTLLSFANTAGNGGQDNSPCCTGTNPLSQGFWKHHLSSGTFVTYTTTYTGTGHTTQVDTGLSLGDTFYSQDDLQNILNNPGGGNAMNILGVQEVAAKLNIMACNMYPQSVTDALTNADALLQSAPYHYASMSFGNNFATTDQVDPSSADGTLMTGYASTLDSYNV
jgi:hypothetical protein